MSLAITLAVVMIVLLVVLTVGWVLLNVLLALTHDQSAGVYWMLLSIGTTFIVLLLGGVVTYLALSVKSINLNRRQSNFVDSVTHELKSPITSLKLALQTLNRRQLTAEQQTDFHRIMLEDVERLDRLINQVLDVGRLEAGAVDGELDDVPLAPLVRHCAEMVCLRYRVPADTVCLDLQPCTLHARQADLDIIFRNLLDNAVKYAGPDPKVHVTARWMHNGPVVVQVCDNGRGIPPSMRRKIFGRFVRLGLELEREKTGTGLGLHIVRTLVRRLRGTIHVRDRPDGPGALFEVTFPGGRALQETSKAPGGSEACDGHGGQDGP
jgi:signal transduction histidine kinase